MKKLIPVFLAVFGLAIGTAAGLFLKPAPNTDKNHPSYTSEGGGDGNSEAPSEGAGASETGGHGAEEKPVRRSERQDENTSGAYEYVKLSNQFVVPVVSGSRVAALVVMSLSIEVETGKKEMVYEREPKLRDAFLQVLFDHANSGGFDGAFTSGEKMSDLRGSLFDATVKVLGAAATDVLVIDIVRQDI